ncbi:hypothetical protein GCM10025883_36950 [Mobilicoccus caccae]|uniref:Uncharacterized protein n=1 Tax=Mobilicoccus caccae TaxID=1859295 RepID=A0ABQ6IUQ1_9MICO|nr:hypothetical protein GCM10025883_36950 [Mobilicoccus caccae]
MRQLGHRATGRIGVEQRNTQRSRGGHRVGGVLGAEFGGDDRTDRFAEVILERAQGAERLGGDAGRQRQEVAVGRQRAGDVRAGGPDVVVEVLEVHEPHDPARREVAPHRLPSTGQRPTTPGTPDRAPDEDVVDLHRRQRAHHPADTPTCSSASRRPTAAFSGG